MESESALLCVEREEEKDGERKNGNTPIEGKKKATPKKNYDFETALSSLSQLQAPNSRF